MAWIHHEAQPLPQIREPWGHGTIYRDRRYPKVADLNYLRISEPLTMSPEELYDVAEGYLGEYSHRRLHFDSAADAEPFRELFRERGYMVVRLTWLHFEGDRGQQPRDPRVRAVDYDTVDRLRGA